MTNVQTGLLPSSTTGSDGISILLLPVATVTSRNFGRITSAGDPRIVQFALKLAF